MIQPRATPWVTMQNMIKPCKGAIGKGMTPFQGSLLWDVLSQGVALGYNMQALRAKDHAAKLNLCKKLSLCDSVVSVESVDSLDFVEKVILFRYPRR